MFQKIKSVRKFGMLAVSLLLIAMLASTFGALSLSQSVASAAETPVVEVTTRDELRAAVANVPANGSGTIKVKNNFDLYTSAGVESSYAIVIPSGKTITVDLNGFTLNYNGGLYGSFQLENNANLIIDDSSATKLGKLTDTTNGNEMEEHGIIHVPAGSTGNVTIKNGTIDAMNRAKGILNQGNGTVTIEGGKIFARSSAINSSSGEGKIVITGGSIEDRARTVASLIYTRGQFTMSGGEIKSEFLPEYINGEKNRPYYAVDNYGQMAISGGNITSKYCATIKNNTDGVITISGGKVTSAVNLAAGKATIVSVKANTPNIKIISGEVSNTNAKEGFSVAFPGDTDLSKSYTHTGGKVGKVYPGTAVVTYDTNGGTAVEAASIPFLNKVPAVTSTRDGGTLEGWYRDVAFEGAKWDFDTDIVSESMMLYAKWSMLKYRVIFNSNGGSAVAEMTGVEHGSTIAEPTDPTHVDSSNRFVGWYKDAAFTTRWNFAVDKVEERTTLYAKWSTKMLLDVADYKFEGITTAYTGSPVTIVATGFAENITVSYTNNSLTDVGTIEARATFVINPLSADYYEFADGIDYLTANITITKAPVTLTWSQDNKTASPSVSGATVTYTYSSSESGEYTATVPTAPGTYWVKATVAATNNYNSIEQIKSFTITATAVASANLTWLWVLLCIILVLIIAYVATFFLLYKRGVITGDVWAKIYLPLIAIFKDKK